jgi:hypothetical protein
MIAPEIAWPWIDMPAVLSGTFQSVGLLPARVIVKPATVTLLAAITIVLAEPPIGPLTVTAPDPAPSNCSPTVGIFRSSL